MSDLNEESLLGLMESLKGEAFTFRPTRITISPQYLEEAKQFAKHDPEFARIVKEEFGIDLLEEEE